MDDEINFKPKEKKDIAFITGIYNFFILKSTATYHIRQLSKNEMQDYFMLFDPLVDGFIISIVEKAIGFCLIKPYNKDKEGYNLTYEITIYIKNRFHHKGIGKKAIKYLENIAKIKNIHVIIAGICTENIVSTKFFESCGYSKCGIFKEVGYKFDRLLDNVYYQKILKSDQPKNY
ncbi:MAG: N-acetyltransferase [Candidatus Lokiarchaeota archaeon]|nr:N-acetyltransferase [Candidatus Lokiarchaeota archaeon]